MKYSFIVDTPKKSLMFHSSSEEEKEGWVNSIAEHLQKTKEKIGSFSVRERKRKIANIADYIWKHDKGEHES